MSALPSRSDLEWAVHNQRRIEDARAIARPLIKVSEKAAPKTLKAQDKPPVKKSRGK